MAIAMLTEQIKQESATIRALKSEIQKIIVGQEERVEALISGIIADGHILLEGVPGLAKTTGVRAFAAASDLEFKRIQFTPDLLPADIMGSRIFNMEKREFEVKTGVIFANVILADEINRAPAKVQSALLEAMQERQVTIGDKTFPLPDPFIVLATQNPIEQEGTYPLPEAQVDRFMFKVLIGYPSRDEEMRIVERHERREFDQPLAKIVNRAAIKTWRSIVGNLYTDERIRRYAVSLVFETREARKNDLRALIEVGASPRASIYLVLAARIRAFMEGRAFVTPDDVKEAAYPVLRHRIIPSFEAEAEKLSTDEIVRRVLEQVEVP